MKLNKISLIIMTLGLSQFTYAEQTQHLEDVTVRAKRFKPMSQASDGSLRDSVNLGLLGRYNAFTSPITVVNYDEKAFADKSPRNIVDVMAQTDASVMAFGGETNTLQGIYVRGLQLDARQFSVNGLAGLYSSYSSPTSSVASAQLIKGASSATVGMDPEGAVGAAVNIETKKATNEPINKIGLGWYSDSRYEPSVDFGRRFGANKEWGIRLNSKYRDGNTPRTQYEEKTKEAALNLDYRGEQFKAALDASYNERATTGGRARVHDIQLFGFRLPEAPKGDVNLAPAWQHQTNKDKTVMATFEYDTLKNVILSGGIGHMESRYFGNFAQIQILNEAGDYRNGAWNSNTQRFAAQGAQPVDFVSRTTSANLKARGDFMTGNISHNWSVAADYVKRSRDHDNGTRANNRVMTGLNIYAPHLPAKPADFTNTTHNQGADNTFTAPSLAISDTIGLMDEKIRLTLGGRLQSMKQENHSKNTSAKKTRFSPMFAAAFVPNHDWLVYGNYLEDLEPGAFDSDAGTLSDPRVSRQAEIGVRKNWGNVVTSANVYQITRPTYWRGSGKTQGKERNRGVELSAYGNLLNKTLRPTLGLSYIKADLIHAPSFTDQIISGTQVASPRVIAKAGVEWDTPFVQGLSVNAGVQHYGKSYQDVAKTHSFRSYTIVDVGAKYVKKLPNNQELTVRGAVENVFNKNYWQVQRGQYDRSFAVVGMPRTFWLKADYSF